MARCNGVGATQRHLPTSWHRALASWPKKNPFKSGVWCQQAPLGIILLVTMTTSMTTSEEEEEEKGDAVWKTTTIDFTCSIGNILEDRATLRAKARHWNFDDEA